MTPMEFRPGMSVRLQRPDNPAHPHVGKVGQVVASRRFNPVSRWRRGVPELVEPACTLLWVRFPGDPWQTGVFDREVTPGPDPP